MADEGRVAAVGDEGALARFSLEIAPLNMMPLWERTAPQRPGGPAVPTAWPYSAVRPRLLEAAGLITKRAAERRVLVYENPSLRGTGYIAPTLYAGMQIIMPGEIAPSHRHTQNALRLFVEGDGAYTSVAGKRIEMRPGDFIVTPAWDWHDHGNRGGGPCMWLDGLDTPFAQFFGAIFREDYPDEIHPVTREGGDSPPLVYRYERTLAALRERIAAPHPAHGVKLRYANPTNGRAPFPTMAVFMQLLPRGFAGARYRSTESAVFCVVEGEGTVELGEARIAIQPHDVFVAPSWCCYRLAAAGELVLFSYSDRAAQEALGFFREEPA
jgi:gentisate 1,2-dioxygenase